MSTESLGRRVNLGGLITANVSPEVVNIQGNGREQNNFQLISSNNNGQVNVRVERAQVDQLDYRGDDNGSIRINLVARNVGGPQVAGNSPNVNSQINVSGVNVSNNPFLGNQPLTLLNDNNQ